MWLDIISDSHNSELGAWKSFLVNPPISVWNMGCMCVWHTVCSAMGNHLEMMKEQTWSDHISTADVYGCSQDHQRQASAAWHLIFHTVMPSFNRPEMCFAFSIQMDLKMGKLVLDHLIRASICLLRLIARARESNCLADCFRALDETQINRSD